MLTPPPLIYLGWRADAADSNHSARRSLGKSLGAPMQPTQITRRAAADQALSAQGSR